MDRLPLIPTPPRGAGPGPRPALLSAALALGLAGGSLAAAEAPTAAARDAAWLERLRRGREALLWTDEQVAQEWRLQRRAGGDEWRVLDPQDRVVHEGPETACREALAGARAAPPPAPPRDEAVLLLHGLGEGRDSMQPLAEHLRQTLDATVLTVGYASVKADIDAHGAALGRVIAGLPEVRRISFVGHSLGNLVIRRWLGLAAAADLGRVHRVVMLGPPNQGSQLARMAARIWGVAARAEGAARDLVVGWDAVAGRLAVPACEFGIVAGGKGDDAGYSLLLSGDDDAVVRVEETRLPGATDFLLLPVHHAAMMRNDSVQRATTAFLRDGRFVPADERPAETTGQAGHAGSPPTEAPATAARPRGDE